MQLLLQAVFAITGFVLKQQYSHAQNSHSESGEGGDIAKSIEHAAQYSAILHGMHNHTFIALIDIVFTDGTKRTCTGSIIHDNVVITVRHCFGKTEDKFIQPELTASFVVIGSKKMFETGYEQYLPIERIVSHSKYRGWTADIALVYTFAGMMSDKPGTLLPLAGKDLSISHHSNVTVFSWGHSKTSVVKPPKENELKNWKRFTKYPLRAKDPFSSSEDILPISLIKNSMMPRFNLKANEKTMSIVTKKYEEQHKEFSMKSSRVTEGLYRSQTSAEYTDEDIPAEDYGTKSSHKLVADTQKHFGSIFKNWRRSIGSEKNELSVESFKLINMETCEEKMKIALPDKYRIKNFNEYICYTNEERFVTDEDAGAPAVHHGHLIAITVGGVECEDEHVAVGIKISCFCNWISDNLPNSDVDLKCCDNCCDDEKLPDEEDKEQSSLRLGRRKKSRPKI